MDFAPKSAHSTAASTFVGADLLLADRVLTAFESGRVGMRADDFRDISRWAFNAFTRLDVETLRGLERDLAGPLKEVAQNVLFMHGDAQWATNDWDNRWAENAWADVHRSMRR